MIMKRHCPSLSIFPKMLISMLIIALLPVAGLWYLFYSDTLERTTHELNKNLGQTSKILAGKVNSWIDINIRSSQQIARMPDIISMDPKRQYPLLKATDDTYEWSYTAFTTDTNGQAVTRSDGKPLKYYGDREYVRQVLAMEPIGQQVLISRVNGKPALCLSVPVKKTEKISEHVQEIDRVQGVLVQCSKLVEITKAISVLKIGNSGFAFLVDKKGRLISHGDQSKLSTNLANFNNNQAVRLGKRSNGIISFQDNSKKIVAHTQKLNLDWLLVVQQDYDEAFAPLIKARTNAYFVLIITVLIVSIFAFFFANMLSRPICILTDIADQFSKGRLTATIPGQERKDEIGALARAVDRLGTSFKLAMKRVTNETKI